jgi:hypothetical protein
MSDPAYGSRPLKWAHHRTGRAGGVLSDFTTIIEIQDEGDGEFLHLSQPHAHVKLSAGGIAIAPNEWPSLRAAIDEGVRQIEKHGTQD